MNKELEKMLNDLYDTVFVNVYKLSAEILLRKVKNKEKYNNEDWKVLKIILEDYVKRQEN